MCLSVRSSLSLSRQHRRGLGGLGAWRRAQGHADPGTGSQQQAGIFKGVVAATDDQDALSGCLVDVGKGGRTIEDAPDRQPGHAGNAHQHFGCPWAGAGGDQQGGTGSFMEMSAGCSGLG